jgi:glycosyltransferase involved in cell wall biosynthesis
MRRETKKPKMNKTRVAIIGTTGLPARYGGFETLAEHLVSSLATEFDMTVYCSSMYFGKKGKRPDTYKGARLQYINLNANGYQSIPYDFISMIHAVRNNDVLLVLGVSGALLLPFLKLFTKKPVLVNIDGQEWKREKWNWLAKKVLGFSEKLAVAFADEVITDNKVIQNYVERGYRRDKTLLIEYGGDHVKHFPVSEETRIKYPFLQQPYAFNVSRIEPENNIHLILDAFSRCPERNLVIVGLWNHGQYGIDLKQKYSGYPNIFLLDPIYDQDRLNEIRANADVYVHGHSAGGTNPSLVEAMCLGLTVISYGVSYNRETTNHRARYFNNKEELLNILRDLTTAEKKTIGQEMKQYGLRKYTWQRITSMYASLFRGEQPTVDLLLHDLDQKEAETVEMNYNTEILKEA